MLAVKGQAGCWFETTVQDRTKRVVVSGQGLWAE